MKLSFSRIGAIALAGISALAVASPVSAHHSFAMFDQQKDVLVTGTVKEFVWTNPHASLTITAPDPATGSPADWWIEMSSLGGIARGGWRRDTVKPGDKITVSIHPLKDGSTGGQFLYAELPDGRKLGQVDGGFSIANPGGDEAEVAKERERIQRAQERRQQQQQAR